MQTASHRYTSVAITLHWLIAAALVGQIFLGWNMHSAEDQPIDWLYQLHKSFGITELVLTNARIVWRVMNPPPPLPAEMAPREKTASHLVHLGFYGLMLAIPITGWILVSTSSFGIATVLYGLVGWPHLPGLPDLAAETKETVFAVAEFLHSKMAWLVFLLLALHLGGALKHELSEEEGVLKRMVPGLFGRTSGPEAPSRGALYALAASLGFFALVTCAPMVAGGAGAVAPAEASLDEANWTVDYEASELGFAGVYNGRPFEGRFGDWSAAIAFDPDRLDESRVSVSIAPASVDTGVKLNNDTLQYKEWFNTEAFPAATVALSGFEATEAGYTAAAQVTIKDQTVEVPFDFTLSIEGGRARMEGAATLSRTALDLGQSSDAGASYVSEEITVDVIVEADRAS